MAIRHHLVLHAKMIRSIRNTPDADTGIMCHFINICYWGESQNGFTFGENKTTLLTRAFVELLKHGSFLDDPDRQEVVQQIMPYFFRFIDDLENQINSQSGAVANLDAIIVFTIGVLISKQTPVENPAEASIIERSLRLSQVQNVLAMLAARQPAVRGLRDIVSALQRSTITDESQRLRSLVASSEIVISRPVQTLLFSSPTFARI